MNKYLKTQQKLQSAVASLVKYETPTSRHLDKYVALRHRDKRYGPTAAPGFFSFFFEKLNWLILFISQNDQALIIYFH